MHVCYSERRKSAKVGFHNVVGAFRNDANRAWSGIPASWDWWRWENMCMGK